MEPLTDKSYWDDTYRSRKPGSDRAFDSFLNYSNRAILGKLRQIDLTDKAVLEIGAGDSLWTPYLARAFPSSRFTGLDYSERGCALLRERALGEGVAVDVVHQDMFVPVSALHAQFDVVFSLGVVEHFDDLALALQAQRRYLRPGGVLFTLIPNMAGLMGRLTRRWNPAVFDKHNPHDLERFLAGHHAAGLRVVSGAYLGSVDFGVLASCFADRNGVARQLQRGLIAGSVAVWWMEGALGLEPTSRLLSPYLYAISQ